MPDCFIIYDKPVLTSTRAIVDPLKNDVSFFILYRLTSYTYLKISAKKEDQVKPDLLSALRFKLFCFS